MKINNMHLNASPEIFRRAKALRKKMTAAEQKLWSVLKNKQFEGLKFRIQHPILKFILDFYCHEIKLGIEVDGRIHNDKSQKIYDDYRTDVLKEFGITIIRFSNDEILNDIEKVKRKIIEHIITDLKI